MPPFEEPRDAHAPACPFQTASSHWKAVAAPFVHGYGQQASCQCAAPRSLYIVAGRSRAIHVIGVAKPVRSLKARFRHLAGLFITYSLEAVFS
jgi:hypothetical protein